MSGTAHELLRMVQVGQAFSFSANSDGPGPVVVVVVVVLSFIAHNYSSVHVWFFLVSNHESEEIYLNMEVGVGVCV